MSISRRPFVVLCAALSTTATSMGAIGCSGGEGTHEGRTAGASTASSCGEIVAKVTKIAPKGDPFLHRTGHSMAAISNDIYIVRGVVDDFTTQTNTFPEDVVRFHPSNGKVTELRQRGDEIPGGWSYSCMAADDHGPGSLYLFGGANYVFELRPDFFSSLVVSDQLWKYDTGNKRWTAITPSGSRPAGRSGCTAAFVDGAMYMFAGISRFFEANNEMWKFDPATSSWTALTPEGPVPSPRYKPLAALDETEGKIYYYGGLAFGPEGFNRIDDFWVYDVATNTFRELPSEMQPVRDQGALAVLKGPDGKKYVVHVGGDLPTDVGCTGFPQLAKATNEVWAFDVSTETWRRLETEGPMPRIEYHAGAAVKNRLYFAGGWAEEPDPVATCRQVWNESFYELSLVFEDR